MKGPETQSINLLKASFGLEGVETHADTDAHSGAWCALQALEETSFTSLTRLGTSTSWSGRTIAAGQVVYGRITGFTLASGAVDAFDYPTL